jgi:glucosylceramidase
MLNQMPEEKRNALLKKVYSPDECGFSMGRICVGSSDYAEMPYHFASVPDDLTMQHFDASHDAQDILPILKKAREYNPELFLFSSPWSPPGWMKTSGQMQGGWMREKYLDAYALYYLHFLEYYRDAGVRINALTPQNESETDQTSRMPACLWHPEMEMEFAKNMRRLLDKSGFKDVKIWLMDHNFNMWRRACFEMNDADTRAACAGIAWHPYEGSPKMINWFRRQFPECENHWTEGGVISSVLTDPNYEKVLSFGELAHGLIQGIQNGCQSITVWNLALDQEGYPNIGPFNCHGTIEISSSGEQISFSNEFYVLTHFSKYICRGARRIVVKNIDIPQNFAVAAFQNPDGSRVVVVANTGCYDSDLNLIVEGKCMPLHLLRESVNTVLL